MPMKIRLIEGPVPGLRRVQIDEHVCYVRLGDHDGDGAAGLGGHHAERFARLPLAGEPVFQTEGCSIYVRAYSDRTELIVVKEIWHRPCPSRAA
jgi:hypothetical protein